MAWPFKICLTGVHSERAPGCPHPLKRSFDIDDVNEIPTFSPTSSVTSPISPSAILNKTNDVRSPGNQVSPPYRSRISISCSPAQSPVLKNRMVSSLSFNRGTMGKPTINANTGINRAASFQNKFNPNGFTSSSGPGSDNDSLHSSSSSLEYQASSKLCSYTSPPQSPVGVGEFKAQRLGSPALKKFSSHGNMFHSELEGPLVIPTEPMGISHGSMPSLDLQMETAGMRRVISPGSRFTNTGPQWNTSPHNIQNSSTFARDSSFNSQTPRPKDPVRLNKFPLDLDNLVFKSQTESPGAPKPPPRFHTLSSSPTVSASPSASISSLDSTDLPMAHNNNNNITEKKEPITPPGAIPVPNISESPVPLSPAQTPQFNVVSKPQVVQVAPASPHLSRQMAISNDIDQDDIHAKESVGSILQRIASFSKVETKVPVPEPSLVIPLSNGIKKDSPAIQRKEFMRSEGPLDFRDVENTDGIAESSHKKMEFHGICQILDE
ncbi:9-cis-epoxycarotenoid dioxygenase NCED6, chloroplastic [Labeo rohita]|uniref:9-cis-epoxycarotenoid dioxygenase NCED6, chloroplastic n=1 Tax=Labeo rohita TaxID=84645 RepID=A0ABQ8MVW2_LABRO|nr:9-cis-epoxycarotenoid dioxygenase NCED6, chloroplastic [Labeo rohita]